MFNLKKIRIKQLNEKEEKYKDMERYKDSCPKDIITYLMNISRLNRIQSIKMYDTSLFSFYDKVQSNLEDIDEELKSLQDILSSDNFCVSLRKYIGIQNKYINSQTQHLKNIIDN